MSLLNFKLPSRGILIHNHDPDSSHYHHPCDHLSISVGTNYQDSLEKTQWETEENNCTKWPKRIQGCKEEAKTNKWTMIETLDWLQKDLYWRRKIFHSSTVFKDSKLYINKFIDDKILIYLGARKFEKTRGYSVKWIAKSIREENEENDMSPPILKK